MISARYRTRSPEGLISYGVLVAVGVFVGIWVFVGVNVGVGGGVKTGNAEVLKPESICKYSACAQHGS